MANLFIERIDTLSSFEEIRDDWERLYQADSNSHIYISWLWQHHLFASSLKEWIILGIKNPETSNYIAFLPLTIDEKKQFGFFRVRNILFGGKPTSIYSGFLCSPDYENEAIRLLAEYIQSKLKWDSIHFTWIKDPRLSLFLNTFPNSKFTAIANKSMTALKITLTDNFQTYLENYISKDSRRMIKRKSKIILQNENYEIRYSTAKTIRRDIDTFCKFWIQKWEKPAEAEIYRNTLHYFFKNDLLKLSILWDGELAISGQACLLDPVKSIYTAYCTSFNRDYNKISPGFLLVANSINDAIELNYQYFDFTVGLDPYKLSFGPEQIDTMNFKIKRKNLKNLAISLAKKLKHNLSLP